MILFHFSDVDGALKTKEAREKKNLPLGEQMAWKDILPKIYGQFL